MYQVVVPSDIRVEIRHIKSFFANDCRVFSYSDIIEDVSHWVPDPGHARGRRKQNLNSITLHWQLKTLIGGVLKERQEEQYDIFYALNYIKCAQRF